MKKHILHAGTSLLFASVSSATLAADLERGEELHTSNCVKCHTSMMGGDGSTIYTRENRRMDSIATLRKQVHRCKNSLGVSWPEDQIEDVVAYLNKTYYQFKE